MQRVRADGIARLDALDGGRAEPISGSLAHSLPEPFEYPLAIVDWHDAWFDFDQDGPDDCRHDYLVRTVGFLVGEGPRFVSLAQEVLPDGEGLRAVTHIPLPIVERIVRLDPSTDIDGRLGSPPLASG